MAAMRPTKAPREARNPAVLKESTNMDVPQRKKTVSAGAIFRNQPPKRTKITSQASLNIPHILTKDACVQKSGSAKSQSSTRSPIKRERIVTRKKPDTHPVAVAFKDTTNDYRSHLYNTATTKLNETLSTFLSTLHQSTLQPISSPTNTFEPKLPPIKLTVPAELERSSTKIFRSLGTYTISTRRTNMDGEEPYNMTLHNRMAELQQTYMKDGSELRKLQEQWEMIIGEIWIVGVNCLGEEAMQTLFFTTTNTASSLSPLDWQADDESTPFVAEEGSPPLHAPSVMPMTKKCVTFQTPDADLPDFLFQKTRFTEEIANLPDLPGKEVQELEETITTMGKEQLEDLKKIEKEQQKWWKKKKQQIAMALGDD